MTQSNLSNTEAIYNRIDKYRDMVTDDPYRLHYHLMPPVGLLNDPNGLVFFKGKYHVFYQWNPFETAHGIKYWGHYISDDLIHWEPAPIALAPDQWYDKDGCYSGSAIVHNGKMYLFYTGNVKDESNNRESYQCMAVSENGISFEKKGPVIHIPEGYTSHFRDPKVFYKDNLWYMVIGAQTIEGNGEVVLYSSPDLENWDFLGPIAGSNKNGLGEFGYMWECPDLFTLHGKDLLIFSPQGLEAEGYRYNNVFQSGYLAGDLDLHGVTFKHGTFDELDRGFDFYAPQTTNDNDGRRILFGWMGNAETCDTPQPTVRNHWIHALTIPRQLEWKDGKLYQRPVEELEQLRENGVNYTGVEFREQEKKLEGVKGTVFELQIAITEWQAESFSVNIGHNNRLIYNQSKKTFTFQRKRFTDDTVEYRHCQLDTLEKIHLFKDSSSIEVFLNNGQEVFSSRVFDEPDTKEITFSVDGTVTADVYRWNLKKVCE
ncbi:glycoside hydrolase family 32 protein [Virgibacillus kekensis]|uniref:Sucrose-6-phosphate hydrolase n=1 Tax=Virgibacillus kekensis TaxID=202261 RepID=A0ABV9DML3_9BACI